MKFETVDRTFLNIPIVGTLNSGGYRHVEQWPIERLAPLMQAVLEDPGIEEFGWKQYTPFFNDGEPCVFGVGDVWFLSPEDADDEEDQKRREEDPYAWEEDHHVSGQKGFAKMISKWVNTEASGHYQDFPNPNHDEERHGRCCDLSSAIGSGHYDTALLGKFGDHANIKITRDSIEVEFYDHE